MGHKESDFFGGAPPTTARGETSLARRWLDKALLGAIAAIVALVGLVYGAIAGKVNEVDKVQRDQDRRVTITEQQTQILRAEVQEIKADVKAILREVKK